MYATKRRRRNVKNYKHPPKENQKSNPSKRHRERLNAELENLSNLLPFEQTILTKLDKLSILRLAVSYLRIKSYFQVSLKVSNYIANQAQQELERKKLYYIDPNFSEGTAILESLNGFILIANSNSEVFYASRTVEQYLGFHQSDIIHQSIYELIHSEDRDEFKRHLCWNSKLPSDKCDLTLNDLLTKKEYAKYLDRNFTVRFRCLLDNTSGFVTLDIIGRLSVLYGQRAALPLNASDNIIQNKNTLYPHNTKKSLKNSNNLNLQHHNDLDEPILALFAVACPFGPPSLFELPHRETLFKSKHKVTLQLTSLDPRGKSILGYNDHDLTLIGGYDLIHPDDLKYYSNGHKELLKTGTSGLVCYRVLTKDQIWQWLQSSMRIIYKSNKPECVIANHRPLTVEEGEELYYKRGTEFKLPYPCLYDFEANFGGLLSNYCGNDEQNYLSISKPSQSSQNRTASSSYKTAAITDNGVFASATPPTTTTKTKSTKGTKAARAQQQQQQQQQQLQQQQQQEQQHHSQQLQYSQSRYCNSSSQSLYIDPQQQQQQTQLNHSGYFNTLPIDTSSHMPVSFTNDYHSTTTADNYHYANYLTELNTYNYPSYIADSTNKLYNTPYSNHSFLYNNVNTNQFHTDTTTIPATNDCMPLTNATNTAATAVAAQTWFDVAATQNNFTTSKLLPNNYFFTNYSNTNYSQFTPSNSSISSSSSSSNYNELLNGKYTTAGCTSAGTTIGSTSSTALPVQLPGLTSNSYDYALPVNKYQRTGATTKQSVNNFSTYDNPTQSSIINSSKYLQQTTQELMQSTTNKNGNEQQQQPPLKSTNTTVSSCGSTNSRSSTSPSSSSSPTPITNNVAPNLTTNPVSLHDNSNAYSTNYTTTNAIDTTTTLIKPDLSENINLLNTTKPVPTTNLLNSYINKKYLLQFNDKTASNDNEKLTISQTNNTLHDRNSLSSSYSTCSSTSSTNSNYCDEANAKFLKQENCMIELPVILNNTNNIRYYADLSNFYSNDVNIS